jgi:hypothetical protein
MRLATALWSFPWLIAACAATPPPGDPIKALRTRAASDLSCPVVDLRIAPMGDQTFGEGRIPAYQEVEGCSMHVIYAATKAGYVLSSPKNAPPAHAPDHVDVR